MTTNRIGDPWRASDWICTLPLGASCVEQEKNLPSTLFFDARYSSLFACLLFFYSDVSSLGASRAPWTSSEDEEEEEKNTNNNNNKSSSHLHHTSSQRPIYPVMFQKLKDMQHDNDDDDDEEEEVVFDYNNIHIPAVVTVTTQNSESSGCTADIVFDLVRAARVELKGGHVHDQQQKKTKTLKNSTCNDHGDNNLTKNPLHMACDCLPASSAPGREEEKEPPRRFRNLRTIYAAKPPPDDNNYHDFDELEESFEVTVEEQEDESSPFVEVSFETIDESFELAVDEAFSPLDSGFDLFFCNAFLRGSSMY